MNNPDLYDYFANSETALKEALSASLQANGWSPSNPEVYGLHLNSMFYQVFGYLNFLKKKGISAYESDGIYEAFDAETGTEADLVRLGNKIYYCKVSQDGTTEINPATNPDEWGIFFDFENPVYEKFAEYALLAGDATKNFNVKAGTSANHAINKQQLDSALSNLDITSITGFKNLILNGCKRVNQRGAASIDETASAYNFDRWYYDGTNFIQYIEDKNIVLSGTYTLSWIGTATATVDGASVSNGGQVTLTANTQCEVKFNSSDFNFVQLEYGTKATNFEVLPFQLELFLCYRYFQIPVTSLSFYSCDDKASSLGTIEGVFNIPTYGKMRITPTILATNFKYSQDSATPVSFTPNVLNVDDIGISLGNGFNQNDASVVSISGEKLELNAEIYPI